MGLLEYKSNEMFSATELIRKSKNIFDKVESKEIDKAIILRDGKPAFMLLEFKQYEELMNELEKYRNTNKNINIKEIENITNEDKVIDKNVLNENTKENYKVRESSNNNDDKLLAKLDSIEGVINNDNIDSPDILKDFWE